LFLSLFVFVGTEHQENALRTKLLTDAGAGCLKTRAPLQHNLCWVEDVAPAAAGGAERAESKPVGSSISGPALTPAVSSDDIASIGAFTSDPVSGSKSSGRGSGAKRDRASFSPSSVMEKQFGHLSLASEGPATLAGDVSAKVRGNPNIYKAPICDLLR
jgi:hypothetical protein